MSFMESIMGSLKLNEEEGYDEGDYLDGDDPVTEHAPHTAPKSQAPVAEDRKPLGRTAVNKSRRLSNGMEVVVFKPVSIEDEQEIADYLLSNKTVVLNMEGVDSDIAQCVLDFTSGATYAINGNLQKISKYIFIITPSSVDISGDFPGLIGGSLEPQ